MMQHDFVIFAELNRDRFDGILGALKQIHPDLQSGRQGDDWIWIFLGEEKIEIDSFYSENLQVKGLSRHVDVVKKILDVLDRECILKVFEPPLVDETR